MAFPTGWGRRVPIVIQASKVDANLTDFPVLVTEANLPVVDNEIFDADGTYPARADGGDIRFSSDQAGSVPLAREVKEFTRDNNPANGTAQIWVKVGSISSATDTTIYLWYNAPSETEPAADSAFGSENAWDGNSKLVLHLDETVNNDVDGYKDSTANATHGQGVSMSSAASAAVIGLGQTFDGSADWIDHGDVLDFEYTDSFTLSCWYKQALVLPTRSEFLIAKRRFSSPYNGWNLAIYGGYGGDPFQFDLISTSANLMQINWARPADTAWHHVMVTYDGSATPDGVHPYVDGVADGSKTTRKDSLSATILTAVPLQIAGRDSESSGAFGGMLDEVRISATERSAAWVKAEYESANDPNAFAPDGTPGPPPTFTDVTADFNSTGSDVQLFVNNGDRIYIGKATTFSEVDVALAIGASSSITPTFEVSDGASGWISFTPVDSTDGFQNNGTISWGTNPGGWAQDTVNGVGSKYWLRITRGAAGLATPPTEDLIQINIPEGYGWDVDGNLTANTVAAETVTGINVTSGLDPGHTHSAAAVSAGWTYSTPVVSLITSSDRVQIGPQASGAILHVSKSTSVLINLETVGSGYSRIFFKRNNVFVGSCGAASTGVFGWNVGAGAGNIMTLAAGGHLQMDGDLTVTGGDVKVGVDGTTAGALELFGNSTTTGGSILLYPGNNDDTETNAWIIQDISGGFSIGAVGGSSGDQLVLSINPTTRKVSFNVSISSSSTIDATDEVTAYAGFCRLTDTATGAGMLRLERNTEGGYEPALINMESDNGTDYFLWFTNAGVLNVATSEPGSDASGGPV